MQCIVWPRGVSRRTRLVWERPEPAERRAPSPLSRERIVAAAMTLADAEGLEAVSLRKVAAALDAGPMRLYRYVGTKEELLELMADAVYAEIPPPTGSTWRDILRSSPTGSARPPCGTSGSPTCSAAGRTRPRRAAQPGRSLWPRSAPRPASATPTRHGRPRNTAVLPHRRRPQGDHRPPPAERATGHDERQWQRASGPYLKRMLATGNYPALAEPSAKRPTATPRRSSNSGSTTCSTASRPTCPRPSRRHGDGLRGGAPARGRSRRSRAGAGGWTRSPGAGRCRVRRSR